jgi:hypothetical protein
LAAGRIGYSAFPIEQETRSAIDIGRVGTDSGGFQFREYLLAGMAIAVVQAA